jgi:hypothetical protein
MSEEDILDNGDSSGGEEKVTPPEPEPEIETEPIETPEFKPKPAREIIPPITEEGGVSEAATEVAIREGGEQLQPPMSERQKLISQTGPKKQTSIMKTQKLIVDVSKQIEKQTTQINKINQNLQSVQKQMRAGEGLIKIVSQIHSQANQIQRQLFQVQQNIQKRPSVILRRKKK